MATREVIAVQTYLIHFRDRELALAVGAALEGRLAADGREAVALVPAGDGLGLTRAEGGGRGGGRGSYRAAPQVVALYEDGLLEQLAGLGLTAYVGIGPDQEPGVFRWGDGGAMLLPIATARELVAAVATHTPWAEHATRMKQLDALSRPAGPGLSRTLAVAGMTAPLLLAAVPAVAAAATVSPAHPALPAAAGVKAVDTSLVTATTAEQLPPSTQAFLNQIEASLRYYLQQLRQSSSSNTTGMQQLENEIARLANTVANAQTKTAAQPTQTAPQQGSSGGAQQAPTNAGSQGSSGQGQQSGGAQQGQGQQGQGQQGQGQQGQQQGSGQGTSSQGQGGQQTQGQGRSGQGTSEGTSGPQSTSNSARSGQGTSGTGSGMGTSGSGSGSGMGAASGSGGGSNSGGGSSGGTSSA